MICDRPKKEKKKKKTKAEIAEERMQRHMSRLALGSYSVSTASSAGLNQGSFQSSLDKLPETSEDEFGESVQFEDDDSHEGSYHGIGSDDDESSHNDDNLDAETLDDDDDEHKKKR